MLFRNKIFTDFIFPLLIVKSFYTHIMLDLINSLKFNILAQNTQDTHSTNK